VVGEIEVHSVLRRDSTSEIGVSASVRQETYRLESQ